MAELIIPRLYLDIEGVVLADHPPFERILDYRGSTYAPEVIRRLGSTGMEMVLLSNSEEPPQIPGLESARVLARGQYNYQRRPGIGWKAHELLADQRASPVPFVWADDRLTHEERDLIREEVAKIDSEQPKKPQPLTSDRQIARYLLLSPVATIGINKGELAAIEKFAARHLA